MTNILVLPTPFPRTHSLSQHNGAPSARMTLLFGIYVRLDPEERKRALNGSNARPILKV